MPLSLFSYTRRISMHRVSVWALGLLLLAPAAWADDAKDKPKDDKPKTPAEQLAALQKEYQAKRQEYFKAVREAKTNEERQGAAKEKLPNRREYAKRFMEIAEENKNAPEIAAKALAWIVSNLGDGNEADKAFELLIGQHLMSAEIVAACSRLANF